MKKQIKPTLAKRGIKDNTPTTESKNINRKFRPCIVVAVVVAAICIPLLIKVVAHRRAESLDNTKALQLSRVPIFVDFGTTTCAPCKAMLGVMSELKQRFPGKLDVRFVNLPQTPEMARQYGISIIPAQIFYNIEGKELYRHTGFISTKDVIAQWKTLGYDLAGDGSGTGDQ